MGAGAVDNLNLEGVTSTSPSAARAPPTEDVGERALFCGEEERGTGRVEKITS